MKKGNQQSRTTRVEAQARPAIELGDIKALVELMEEHGVVELEIDDPKRGRVRLVRAGPIVEQPRQVAASQPERAASPAPATTAPASALPSSAAAPQSPAPPPELASNQRLVASPMVGTFYRASSPGAPPFVEVGDTVRRGQVLCIIEAMKMMNEIEADTAGRVLRIVCDNGQPVGYGAPLIVLEIG